jgi:E3 ubiquitin-protein ligase HUWE1
LQEKGYEQDLCKEGLYRCNNLYPAAEEYCKAQKWLRSPPRHPPPSNDIEADRSSGTPGAEAAEDTAVGDAPPFNAGFLERSTLAMLLAQASGRPTDEAHVVQEQEQTGTGAGENDTGNGTEFLARALNHILNDEQQNVDDDHRDEPSRRDPGDSNPAAGSSSEPPSQSANQPSEQPAEQSTQQPTRTRQRSTVEDLDAERDKVRSNLIERCLDVLNEHHDVSFELSDLLASATKKHRDPDSFRREVGEILVQSLVSLQMENFQAAGKKVAAYAHILALVLQDRDMYSATLGELKDCFTTLLGFIKLSPTDKSADDSFPWIGHVLLILEKLLSDDAQPPQIQWTPPPSIDDPSPHVDEPAQLEESLIAHDQKLQLVEAVVEILPRVG